VAANKTIIFYAAICALYRECRLLSRDYFMTGTPNAAGISCDTRYIPDKRPNYPSRNLRLTVDNMHLD